MGSNIFKMTTTGIIIKLKGKDQSGLAYLYDHYSAALMGIIVRIVISEKLAEEVLQQTFLKVWDNIDKYDPDKARLFTWMSRIARNSAIDQVRLKKYKNNKKTESYDITVHNSKVVEMTNYSIDIETISKNLDEKYKVIIDHVYIMGYTQSEVAKRLDIPLGTVKTRLRKAISELRIVLKDEKHLFFGSIIILIVQMFLLWV